MATGAIRPTYRLDSRLASDLRMVLEMEKGIALYRQHQRTSKVALNGNSCHLFALFVLKISILDSHETNLPVTEKLHAVPLFYELGIANALGKSHILFGVRARKTPWRYSMGPKATRFFHYGYSRTEAVPNVARSRSGSMWSAFEFGLRAWRPGQEASRPVELERKAREEIRESGPRAQNRTNAYLFVGISVLLDKVRANPGQKDQVRDSVQHGPSNPVETCREQTRFIEIKRESVSLSRCFTFDPGCSQKCP
ncbi:hypothetical protein FB45DRAFT_880897 [Roridomyces roridus]|uniref:Uncharacterized protein n=1 Tax=Roridomyces roridus TaxID=1738132 RepID=A0AAD7F653_9AGAR|nr:hypothetical protein FB45DRAFT_880897 [Roridomyces roridus]